MSSSSAHATCIDALSDFGGSRVLQQAVRVWATLLVTALTAAAAQVSFSIPLTTVPFTLQPMVVLMAGLALGPRLAVVSQVLYLAAGIAGAPVFAWSPTLPMGIARLFGPTGGYLMSYPLAAFVTGYLAALGFDRRYRSSVLAMLAGLVVIYACGTLWLGLFVRAADTGPIGLGAALAQGVYPFVGADIAKVLCAAAVMPTFWKFIRD